MSRAVLCVEWIVLKISHLLAQLRTVESVECDIMKRDGEAFFLSFFSGASNDGEAYYFLMCKYAFFHRFLIC
jgi:hypothetical protein